MTTNMTVTRQELFNFALERARYEHAELAETWKLIDTKAQGTAAIAGVFIAAIFVFVRNANLHLAGGEKTLLLLSLLFLVLSVGFSVWAMQVRTVAMPITGAEAAGMVGDILRQPESELKIRFENLVADTVDGWARVNGELNQIVEAKAVHLSWAQRALLVAAVLTVALTVRALL